MWLVISGGNVAFHACLRVAASAKAGKAKEYKIHAIFDVKARFALRAQRMHFTQRRKENKYTDSRTLRAQRLPSAISIKGDALSDQFGLSPRSPLRFSASFAV